MNNLPKGMFIMGKLLTALAVKMWRLALLLLSTMSISMVMGDSCPQDLQEHDCACSVRGLGWHITCTGYDLVNITRHLPPDTSLFQYTAMEMFVNLGSVNFSRLQELTMFQIKDPRDYKILDRKISPMAKDSQLFSFLPKLRELRININWPMPELPNMLHGLDNLEILDFSNTRWMDIDNLITSFQGLRNNTKMKILNLWNMKTLQHSSPNLHLNLAKLLEPLSRSRLKELNIGYNALRSVGPGLIQYAPSLKRLIVRNNVLIPIVTCSLMTEVVLHRSIVEADFSEQGYRPASDLPIKLGTYNELNTHDRFNADYSISVENRNLYELDSIQITSNRPTEERDSGKYQHGILSLQHFLDVVDRIVLNESTDSIPLFFTDLHSEVLTEHDLPPSVLRVLKEYVTCFILLYNDTCSIFRQECTDVRDLLIQDHSMFCALLNFFFMWHFAGVHCDYIPPFNEIISPHCGACLVMPTSGNLRKLDLSNLNVYDLVIQYGSYRNRPNCFHPNTSAEFIDFTGSAIHGYTEVDRYFASETTGLENLKVFNCSGNFLTVLYPTIGSNYPQLQVMNASHNLLTLDDDLKFANITHFIEVLDLSHNQIQDLHVDKFAKLEHLRRLDLSYNLIKMFNVTLSSSKRLEYLDLSNNALNSLPQHIIDGVNEIALSNTSHVVHVDIASNGLICTCATKNFVQWVLDTHPRNLVFVNSGKYSCTNRYSAHVSLHSVTVAALTFECYENVIFGFVGAVCVLFLVLLFVAYQRRFFLRHKWYTLTKPPGAVYDRQHYEFDAFMCHDDEDSDWVSSAKKKLGELRIASEEDFHPGQNVNQGTEQFITQSKRCILVLSPDFVNNPQKKRQASDVDEHITNTGADIVIIVVLRPLPSMGLDSTLARLMKRRMCLKWRENNADDQAYFWEKLTDVLRAPCTELYDVPHRTNAHPAIRQDSANARQGVPQDSANARQGVPQNSANARQGVPQDSGNAHRGVPQDSGNARQVVPEDNNSDHVDISPTDENTFLIQND